MNYRDLTDTVLNELRTTLTAVDAEQLAAFRKELLAASRIFITGKGRSGLQMRGFAMRVMHFGLQAHVIDDVTTPAITADDLLVIGSGSGKTASLVSYAEKATQVGAKIALLTISEQSPIGELAAVVIRIPAPTPKRTDLTGPASVLPMGSLFEASLGLVLDMTMRLLMDEQGVDSDTMFTRHANME